MELLYKYLNGNVNVSIYDTGTKIQEWEGSAEPIFPNSMDLKITNYCDANCSFCHEMSTTRSRHGNLHKILKVLSDLPQGTELAIGGGNPLDHPDLLFFLSKCKELNLVCNMTINQVHFLPNFNFLNTLINDKLIYGLGISITDDFKFKHLDFIENKSNIVFHVISGVNNTSILDKINESSVKKVLILGYKEVGRGIGYYNSSVEENKKQWFDKINNYIGKVHLSFDNLSISQLKIKRFFSDKKWNNFYMGNDGQFTMYIDAVNEEYAVSSTSMEKYRIEGDIKHMFNKVRKVSNY